MDLSTKTRNLQENLDYWIMINIADDIVTLKDQRKEYAHLVELAKERSVKHNNIPRWVNWYLKQELKRFAPLTKTFWKLL